MRELYFDGDGEGISLEEAFAFPRQLDFAAVRSELEAAGHWSGRLVPRRNTHGITSVEVTLQVDAEDAGRVWLYTLEHPVVGGEVRHSSRSELRILEVLLENTLEYVFFRDSEGRFIMTNKAFREAIGESSEGQPVGKTIDGYVTEDSGAWVREIDRRVYLQGVPSVNNVSRFGFRDGTCQWLQMTTVPVFSRGGEIIGSVSVARDISDLKKTESELRAAIREARAASKAKGEFLAAMSHEIRTPINGIIGAAELCQETKLDPEQRGYLDTVTQCGNTLLSLVNDVLDFSKIEAGQLNLEKLTFNPGKLLDEVADEFAQAVRRKGVELIAGYDEELPQNVLGDPTRLKQIFYNLVGNAVKFTNEGEIVLRGRLLERDERRARILFTVTDTGIGISPSRQEVIFSSFTQEDMSITRKYGGTGLGLAICKELTDLMGGEITVRSQVGEGTTFSVEVPFAISTKGSAEAVPFHPELSGMWVLVVDDNETNREIYRETCEGWGYRCVTEADSVNALSRMEAAAEQGKPFDLLILDQQMPGLTGLDLVSLLADRPALATLRVILLSSSLNRSEVERAEALGVARALSKPVKRDTLFEVIRETFGADSGRLGSAESGAPEGDEGADGATPQTPDGADGEARSLDILLAEDNVVNQGIAKRRVEKSGHRVWVAADGHEALELVRERSFDCILMDVQMPEMDGLEATRAIREWEKAEGVGRHCIVAMTAHATRGDAERCLSAGMDEYLAKPFRAKKLNEILGKIAPRVGRAESGDQDSGESESFAKRFERMGREEREDVEAAATAFLKTLPEELLKLQQALRAKDADAVAFAAHTLKGMAGIFGADRVTRVAEDLEASARSGEMASAGSLAARFREQLRELEREVREVFADGLADGR